MSARTKRRVFGAIFAGLLATTTVITTNVGAATPKTLGLPVTLWSASGITGTGVDGIGSIMAPVTVPTPAAGQATENKWAYALLFRFVADSKAFGVISLDTDGANKFATLSLNNGAAQPTVDTARFPFNWTKDKFYLPMVVMLPGNAVAGFVFDYTAQAWTFVGALRTQASWGELSPVSATLPIWYGAVQDDCAKYPKADFFAYAPYAFDAGQTITSTAAGNVVNSGDCPGTVTNASDPNFRRYEAGSAAGPTTSTSSSSTSTTSTSSTTTTTVA